jgi:hypothetical protein
LAIRSLKAQFPYAQLFPGNFELTGQHLELNDIFTTVNETVVQELEFIRAIPERQAPVRAVIEVGFEERFLAKLALGLGFNILGERFLSTCYSHNLRKMLWNRERKDGVEIKGTGYFGARDKDAEGIMSFNGAYVLAMHAFGEAFGLSVYMPSGQGMHVTISDQPELWQDTSFDSYREGLVFVVIAQLGRFVGPISLTTYIRHKQGTFRHKELADIEALKETAKLTPQSDA